MTDLSAFGLTVQLPRGWDGEISVRPPSGGGVHAAAISNPVLHAANFPMPANRGDFGSGAVEVMGSRGVFIAVLEYDRSSAASTLFDKPGLPRRLTEADFDPNRLQRALPNQAGAQVFFTSEGRAFCLYCVIGNYRLRRTLVPVVNEVLATLEVT